tara:strand:+ start:289 stop:1761 length:1473 start_codon:yes stop_codon:yes gene_type:complete
MSDVGIKSGIEIHQQLDTGKLFCSCPGLLRKDEPDYVVNRRLHAVAGEEGTVDVAVEYEKSREREFSYQGYYDNCCLVDIDEEPPHLINEEALKIALQISLLLNCDIIQDTQIMRKTVIDGSNVSGFQRTVLIAKNGYVEVEGVKVEIEKIILEEDAARIVKQLPLQKVTKDSGLKPTKEKVVYRLDRIGIPLVEITTVPDIKSGKEAKEVALKIGEILRSCKVKRGLGTIRQDVNLSVNYPKGKRIEIKGFQDPKMMIKTFDNEIERQGKLIKQNKSEAEVRKALPDGKTEFLRPLPGRARMYPETDLPLLHISRDMINNIRRTLPRLKSEKRDELKKKGLHDELVKVLLKYGKIDEFNELLVVFNKPELIAKILTIWMQDLGKKLKKTKKQIEKVLTIDVIETILQGIQTNNIAENDVYEIMEDVVSGKDVKKALEREKIDNLEEVVMKIIKEKPGLSINAYMGLVMKKFKGKINGKEVAEIIKKLLK